MAAFRITAAPAQPAAGVAAWVWTAALLGCVLGTAWQVTQGRLWSGPGYQALLLAGLLAWGAGRRCAVRPLLAMACAAAVAAGLAGWRAQAYLGDALPTELEGRDIVVEGAIVSMLQPTAQGQRWRFEVERAALPQQTRLLRFPALIELSWYAERGGEPPLAGHRAPDWAAGQALVPGQRWRMTVRLKRPHGARNPHGFDFELQQWEQGVQALGYVRASPAPEFLEAAAGQHLQRWRQRLRDRILAEAAPLAVVDVRRQAALGVVAALAVGDQQAIAREDWTLFRQTGVAHLMSISGLHITMFAWAAALLVGRLWRLGARACQWLPAQRVGLLAGVLLAAAYALFSGWGLPAQRTVCMLATVAALQWTGVRWPWPCVWLLALAAVVLADPWALWQPGFWLSFVAVGVLLAGGARLPPAPSSRWRRLGGKVLALWREQWLISLALAPLGLLLFGQLSLAGLLANLVAIPWVTLVVTPLALCSALWSGAAAWSAWSLLPLLQWLQWLASWELAVLYFPQPPWWAGVLAIGAGLLLVAPLPRGLRAVAALCTLPALWWPAARPAWGEFELLAADIGQGNAVLLSTRTHHLLYDAGPRYGPDSDAGERVLQPLLQALGVRLDVMLLSHRDLDHTGGALAVKAAQPRAQVWGSDSVIADPALAQLAPVRRCTAGQRWQWDGVELELLHPQPGAAPRESPNAGSCVLRVRSATGRVALLAGDIEARQERQLLDAGLAGPVDWLLVPHHGSKTSSSTIWVQTLAPHWAVVQAGYRNRFGHPVPAVVQRYRQAGSHVVQQDRCGATRWRSTEPQALQCERLVHSRYWDLHQAAPGR